MHVESHSRRELVAAMFSGDFIAGGIDPGVLSRVHAGEHTEWLTALDRSGMFDKQTLAELAEQWRRDPRVLLDALLTDADDVTVRRCLAGWSALDRKPPRTQLG
ncbi:hypothetical protein [Nocardia australiensis]|uniref:hypothetical protein n=1 Tax=Nocardia australiensis TaxID=2887191 RepID=UPI001D135A5A|nr:hypothetical protein [Nocardia australiensis]